MGLWRPGAGGRVLAGVGVLLAGAVVLAVSALADGELARFAGAFFNVAPFVLLAVLAQLQPIWPSLRVLVWLVFGLLMLVAWVVVLAMTRIALNPEGSGLLPPNGTVGMLIAFTVATLGLIGATSLLVGDLWVRLAFRLGGQVDTDDIRHAMGLVGLVAALVLAFVPMIALAGEAPALRMLAADPGAFSGERSDNGQLLDMAYDLAWTIPLALLLVGVPIRRSLPAALARLGIRPLGLRGLAVGIVGAGVLWVVGTAMDQVTYWLWGVMGWPSTDPDLVDVLMGPALSPVGALVAATAAGLGEELLMRGVLQPRFGWLLPNLTFMAAHALQYNLDALLGVFVLGAVLALIRARFSTTEGIVAHGLYDLVLFLGGSL